jgi:hypothetical protein
LIKMEENKEEYKFPGENVKINQGPKHNNRDE